VALVALLAGACVIPSASPGTASPAATAGGSGTGQPTTTPSDVATASPTEAPTATPTATGEPVPTGSPTPEPSTSAGPSPSLGAGPAAACAGNDDNRDFYAKVAADVDWAVYCPVLGKGWVVDAGQYRLRGGGWMEIAYRGPGGARLEFREGAACTTSGCVPSGTDLGEAAFGEMTGTLFEDGGRLAIVVDGGATPSWTLVGTGLDQAAFERVAADLVIVGG
jgi:hypothetical protein